jgi:integrase
LLFTGARLREILYLRWENLDLERGLLLLPDSKTGRKATP